MAPVTNSPILTELVVFDSNVTGTIDLSCPKLRKLYFQRCSHVTGVKMHYCQELESVQFYSCGQVTYISANDSQAPVRVKYDNCPLLVDEAISLRQL